MTGLQSTPVEHDLDPLPESFQNSHHLDHSYPEVHYSESQDQYRSQYAHADPNNQHESHGLYPVAVHEVDANALKSNAASVIPAENKKRVCGIRRRILYFGLVFFVLVAAIVGGVAGGILGSRHKSNRQDGQAPLTTNNLNSPPDTNTSVPAPKPMRAIVAAQSDATIFIFWQVSNGDLYMHGYFNKPSIWANPMKLNMSLPAIDNTPIAAATWQSNDYFEIRMHYTARSQSTLASLVFRCHGNGTLCTNPESNTIPSSSALIAGAGLSLISPSLNILREYMVGSDGSVLEAAYDPTSGWRAPREISNGAKAHLASPVAVKMVKGEIWLFWFNEETRLQMASSVWTSSTWTKVQTIPANIPREIPRSLGVAVSDTPDAVQVFYLDGTKMQQVQYSNSKWSVGDLGSSVPGSSTPNGPIGVAGWSNTAVRMYYLIDGKIKELATESVYGKWMIGTMVPDSYDQ